MNKSAGLRWARTVGLLAGLLAGFLIGCGGGDDGVTQPPPGGQGIGQEGGTAASDDGVASVIIPQGALDQILSITLAPADPPPAGPVPGTAYDFGPDGTQFSLPVSITIWYDEAELPAGTSPQSLQLCEHIGGAWVPLVSYTVDGQNHTLTGLTNHFSTFGIALDGGGQIEELTAYLTDSPDPLRPEEFLSLADAMAWLEFVLGPEDLGTLVWQTNTPQSVQNLSYSFDWVIEVEPGFVPAIQAQGSAPLVIDAGGAINLSVIDISAPGGLVINANRAVGISGCSLPDEVQVNIGGVKDAPFPAGDPSFAAKSARAEKMAKGTAIMANRVMTSLNVQVGGAAQVDGDISITENEVPNLTIGGPAILFPNVCLTVAGSPAVPTPYPSISTNLGGTSQLVIKNFNNAVRLKSVVTSSGDNPATIRDITALVWTMECRGMGRPALRFLDSTVDSAIINTVASTAQITVTDVTSRTGMLVQAQEVTGNVEVQVSGGAYEQGLQVDLAPGGNSTVTLDRSTHTGGRVVIGAEGGSRTSLLSGSGSVSLTNLNWSGGTTDHIDIFGVDCPVTVTGGTYSHSGSPAVTLGLTEINGAINIEGAQFNGAGIGLVDCTGSTTINDTEITITSSSAYGVSMGGCAPVTVQDCNITGMSGGVGVIQTGEMNGNVTITGCSLNGATAATLATFASSTVAMDNNPQVSGSIFIIDSQVHMSGNTFSATLVMDDYVSPGLQNDPVQDNDGLLPGMCYTRMDWDGNGCCDYPPEWNTVDEYGACAVCEGVGGKKMTWR